MRVRTQHLRNPGAAFALVVFGAAIVAGLRGGALVHEQLSLAGWNIPSGARMAVGAVSLTFFVSMTDRISSALLCAYKQLTEPAPLQVLEESIKLLVLFLTLGFPVAEANQWITQLEVSIDSGQRLHPVLVKTGVDRPVAIFPVLFPNAELDKGYDHKKVPPEDIVGRTDLWKDKTYGTNLTDSQPDAIRSFITALIDCTDVVSADEPVLIQVQGFASSREFEWQAPDAKHKSPRDESDDLNLRARRDREEAVLKVIKGTGEFHQRLIRLRPSPVVASLQDMIDRQVYVDRVRDRLIPDADTMTRRADVAVLYAPGCARAEIAAAPAIKTASK